MSFLQLKNIFRYKKNRLHYRQDFLLNLALLEAGLDPNNFDIKTDHVNGYNYVNGLKLEVVYPKYFFNLCEKLDWHSKSIDYYFNGYDEKDGGRRELLRKFEDTKSIIEFSSFGRDASNKGAFNKSYFEGMASARFALCPHQLNWPHLHSRMWTYRFIEACMTFAIPIVFSQTKLSDSFVHGIAHFTDTEIGNHKYSYEDAMRNYRVAFDRHTLSIDCIDRLR